MDGKKKLYVFLGPPGSGKDMQLSWLLSYLEPDSVVGITVSDLIEGELNRKPRAYAELRAQKKQGLNLPGLIVNGLIEQFYYSLTRAVHLGISGACRGEDQARFLCELAIDGGLEVVCIEITLPEEVGIERVQARGREDDKVDVYRGRYQRFREYFPAVQKYLREVVGANYHTVDGNATPEEVFKSIVPFI